MPPSYKNFTLSHLGSRPRIARPGHGSLDYRLRDADNLKSTVHSFLEDLNLYLRETLDFARSGNREQPNPADATEKAGDGSFHVEDNDATSGSDDGGEKEPQWYIDISLESVTDVVDRLYKLSTLIRNPATRLVSSKANHHREIDPDSGADLIDAFSHLDHDYVLSVFRAHHTQLSEEFRREQSFPNAAQRDSAQVWHYPDNCRICNTNYISTTLDDSSNSDEVEMSTRWVEAEETSDFLVHRIARAVNQRRRYFAYWKNHRDKLEKRTRENLVGKPLSSLPTATVSVGISREEIAENAHGPLNLANLLAPPTVTTATILRPVPLLYVDARSETSVSEYAASDWSPAREILQFPEPPKVHAHEKFFVCPYCHTICPRKMLSEKAWKAHLIHDLRPYICTYSKCSSPHQLYDTRKDWTQHEDTFHRRLWRCPDHAHLLHRSQDAFLQHIQTEHPEAFDLLDFKSYLRSCESTSFAPDRPCPVCYFAAADAAALQSHIARHLERFALFSLPRSTEQGDEGTETGSVVAVDAMQSSRNLSSNTSDQVEFHDRDFEDAVSHGDLERVEAILDQSLVQINRIHAALVTASGLGHLDIVSTLVSHGANVDFETDLSSPLIQASETGHIDVVKFLLDAGANPDLDHHLSSTSSPLIAASSWGHADIVTLLLERGARVGPGSWRKSSPLIHACSSGWRDIVEILVDCGADVNYAGLDDSSPLIAASSSGHIDIVEFLVNRGANVNLVDGKSSPLIAASLSGHAGVVERLIERGANPNLYAGDRIDGYNALIAASEGGHTQVVQWLLSRGAETIVTADQRSVLAVAAQHGHYEIVEMLLDHGAEVACSADDYMSPLGEAAFEGHRELVELLLKKGANPNSRAKQPDLQGPVIQGHESIVDILIKAGADVRGGESIDQTLLETAVNVGNRTIVDKLLAAGADPNDHGTVGSTPLHHASAEGFSEIAKVLLDAGANPNAENHLGETPLQRASQGGYEGLVKMLIDYGADLNASNRTTGTALEVALKSGHQKVADILRAAGANPNSTAYHMDDVHRYHQQASTDAFQPGKRGRFWDLDKTSTVDERFDLELVHDFEPPSLVACVNFSWDGKHLALGMSGVARILDTRELTTKFDLRHADTVDGNHFVRSVSFSPDGKALLTGGEDGTVRIWDLDSAEVVFSWERPNKVYAVAFSPDGRNVAAGWSDGYIDIYDVDKTFIRSDSYKLSVASLAFTADCQFLIVGSLDGLVTQVEVHTEFVSTFGVLNGHKDSVLSVAVAPVGSKVYTGGRDLLVKSWMMVTDADGRSTMTRTLQGHEDAVLSVAATADGKWVISGSRDKTFRVWNSETGDLEATVRGHGDSVLSVAACHDQNLIATASGDLTVTVWRLD